ncbi:MAG: carbon-phosphorus lyase complex subunit PhnI [Syntrophorhabdaceae bacterium]|nr:carbon-phosphorus lyase complex subunit PhnI [Syntrophorhabdaceae bacterium]
MGYVAIKGGEKAIKNAGKLLTYERIKGKSKLIGVKQIEEQLYMAVDRVMSEGSLYAPHIAALALKQSAGDTFEASFMVRAYRATKSRICTSISISTQNMRIIRRISAAFKDIPGGQILGPTTDYTIRLLDFELLDDSERKRKVFLKNFLSQKSEKKVYFDSFPKVVDILRKEGLLEEPKRDLNHQNTIFDITRESLTFPAQRDAALQIMSRGETGGLLLLAYSSMRGYGDIHPTIGELRVGFIPLLVKHPYTHKEIFAGEVKVTEAEVLAQYTENENKPKFTLGYGLCFGHNEIKAISMAVLDRAMQSRSSPSYMPSNDQEFVLSHVDGIESMGFCIHYKLPHYVTFQSDLDRLRKTQKDRSSIKGKDDNE